LDGALGCVLDDGTNSRAPGLTVSPLGSSVGVGASNGSASFDYVVVYLIGL
jgi:hypothetical protein